MRCGPLLTEIYIDALRSRPFDRETTPVNDVEKSVSHKMATLRLLRHHPSQGMEVDRSGFRRGVGSDDRLSLLEHRQEVGYLALLHLLESALQGVRNGVELIGLRLVGHFADSRIDHLDGSLQGFSEPALLHIDNRLLHTRQGLGDLPAGLRLPGLSAWSVCDDVFGEAPSVRSPTIVRLLFGTYRQGIRFATSVRLYPPSVRTSLPFSTIGTLQTHSIDIVFRNSTRNYEVSDLILP